MLWLGTLMTVDKSVSKKAAAKTAKLKPRTTS